MLQCSKVPSPQDSLRNLKAINMHFTCMCGPITYWKSIGLEMRLHKHIHIHKGIWTVLGVRWSHALLALPFIVFLLFLGSYKQYGIILILLRQPLWPYSNLIVSHATFITFLLTMNNLMLYLLQFPLVLHLYDNKQSNAPPSAYSHLLELLKHSM